MLATTTRPRTVKVCNRIQQKNLKLSYLLFVCFVVLKLQVQAFNIIPTNKFTTEQEILLSKLGRRKNLNQGALFSNQNRQDCVGASAPDNNNRRFSHKDVRWVLRPSIAPDSNENGQDEFLAVGHVPFLEFPLPRDGKVVLECWAECEGNSKQEKMGRFGITALPGPPHPYIVETIEKLLDSDLSPPLEAGAIIYMVVEEKYRRRGIGELALEVISWIHRQVGCGYTLLVADDNGSGKLVKWYEDHGFVQAPLLQTLLGNPDGIYGVTMIGPAAVDVMPDGFVLRQDGDA